MQNKKTYCPPSGLCSLMVPPDLHRLRGEMKKLKSKSLKHYMNQTITTLSMKCPVTFGYIRFLWMECPDFAALLPQGSVTGCPLPFSHPVPEARQLLAAEAQAPCPGVYRPQLAALIIARYRIAAQTQLLRRRRDRIAPRQAYLRRLRTDAVCLPLSDDALCSFHIFVCLFARMGEFC